jgi:hypothetical protein
MNSLVQRRRAQDVARRLWRVLTTADSPPPPSPPSSEHLVSLSKSAQRRRKRWIPQGLATLGLHHPGTMPPSAPASNSPLPDPWRSSWSIEDVGISLGWPRYGKSGDQEENQGRGSSSPQPPPSPFPLNAYIDLPKDILPEGEAGFYHNPKLTQQQVHQPNHGCKGAQAEFMHSKRRSIIVRQSMVDLFRVIAEGQHSHIFVDGWAGSGKSIALYALAALARSAGWVVMYVPSASMLTRGGRYFKRGGHNDDDDDDDVDEKVGDKKGSVYWDTPEPARRIIQAVMGAHATVLGSMPPGKLAASFSAFSSCSSLAEIAEMGLATTAFTSETAPITVEAALALADGLLSYEGPGPRTLVIVDEYNALYSYTEYFEVMHAHYSRRLSPDELRLASGLRGCCPTLRPSSAHASPSTTSTAEAASLPASNAKNGIFVASPSRGGAFSNKIRIPISSGTFKFYIPRYSLPEVAVTAAATAEKKNGKDEGTTAGGVDIPSDNALRHALALTNGNAKELRENAEALLTDQTTMGVSFGYKVTAAAVKKYNAAVE